MDFTEIQVPYDPANPLLYLSQWPELLNYLPSTGKFILNKERTGCGGTTLFLQSDLPTILVSPRNSMLYNKGDQKLDFPNFHLFRKREEAFTKPFKLKQNLSNYIDRCKRGNPFDRTPKVPKIGVTIDSYSYVAEQLDYMGYLKDFNVVVDEFQCMMSDSKYKGKTEIEFLHNLKGMRSVCYLSATPIEEKYLDMIPDFNDIEHYIRLKWHPDVLEQANILSIPYKKENTKSLCKKIIEDFRQKGYFEDKIVNGQIVYAREAVFFLNEVATTIDIIKENHLNSKDVNVICSLSHDLVPTLHEMGIAVCEFNTDKINPKNRTFTFVTRAGFEGVDFYSDNAFTYIFCDGVLEWNKHDLIIDVPQIMGRQRLASNPFWKDAKLYFRTTSKNKAEEILTRVQNKIQKTDQWEAVYNRSDDETKTTLREEVANRSNKKRYAKNYVEFVDDINGGFVLKRNELVMYTELRDYELSKYVYNSPLYLLNNLTNINNMNVFSQISSSSTSGDPDVDNFNQAFHQANNFPDKMNAYMDLRNRRPDLNPWIYGNAFIDLKYHQIYDVLGPAEIARLRLREKDLEEAVYYEMQRLTVQQKCNEIFQKGNTYRLPDVKKQLQNIYDSMGIKAIAKASELEKFVHVKSIQLTNKETGKRELYYQII